MLSALLSFLGGSAFRFLVGTVIDLLKAKQEHAQQLELMKLQSQLEAERAERTNATIRLQAELGVKQVEAQGAAAVSVSEARAFEEAQKVANTPTGIRFIDAWNGTIRPGAATISLAIWILSIVKNAFAIVEWDKNLVASILGYYFADRHIAKSK